MCRLRRAEACGAGVRPTARLCDAKLSAPCQAVAPAPCIRRRTRTDARNGFRCDKSDRSASATGLTSAPPSRTVVHAALEIRTSPGFQDGAAELGRTMAQSVTIWRIDLDAAAPPHLDACAQVLDAGEKARAERFLKVLDRRRFLAAHGALRMLLAARAGRPPADLAISADAQGKPRLAGGPAFSLSHSGGRAMAAIGGGASLGVDLEIVRPLDNLEAMIDFTCTDDERAHLRRIDDKRLRELRFFECWVKKEAALKALGIGVRVSLRAIETRAGPWIAPDPAGAPTARAHLQEAPWAGAVAAVAAMGEAPTVTMRDFEWERPACGSDPCAMG